MGGNKRVAPGAPGEKRPDACRLGISPSREQLAAVTAPLATQAECDRIRLAAEATLKRSYEHGLAVHLADLFQSRRSP